MSASLLKHFDLLATAPGGVARLRELILTLAVQGKLVPQDANAEPASVLLQKIRAEKDRLIAEGKIKRDKRLAPITDEEKPFELPQGWEWVRLGDICSYIQRGKGPVYADHSAHLVISQKCVRWFGLDLGSARCVTPESLSKYEQIRFLRAGDLLWNSTGTGTIGRACLVPQELNSAGLVADSHVTVVRPIQLDGKFLWRWIQSPHVQDEIEGSASGTTNQIELNTSTVINHLVPLAPLVEQSRVVARVEELMRLCDALEAKGQLDARQHAQLLQTLLGTLTDSATPEELAANWQRVAEHFDLLLDRPEAVDALEQTILQLAVRGLLVSQDLNDEPASVLLQKIRAEKDRLIASGKIKRDKLLAPIAEEEKTFELPAGWVWAHLIQVTLRGPTNGLSPKPQDFQTNVRCLSLSATTQGFFKSDCFKYVDVGLDVAEKYFLKNGDLLIQRGNSIDYVGVAAIYDDSDDAYIYPDLMMRLQLSQSVDATFIHMALMYSEGRSYFKRNATGTQGTMPKVNQATVEGAPLPLPPLAEQSRIVARVEQLRRLCADLRQRLTACRATQAHLAEALVENLAA